MKEIKLKLILMYFLEFAVWGAYLTSLGSFLDRPNTSAGFMPCKASYPYSCLH